MLIMSWIYLSKKGTDEYINRLAKSAGVAPTTLETWDYDQHAAAGLVLRGIMKHKIMKRCWQDRRPFRYVDSGYMGNRPGPQNPNGWKWYHRVVPNDLQHTQLRKRPADRWEKLGLKPIPHRTDGRDIVIVAPDDKPCTFYGIDAEKWLADTVDIIKANTDRPVIIRHRVADPHSRTRQPQTSFSTVLAGDTFAVVTYNSVAAVEAVLAGIPAFVTCECHAAMPVSNRDLTGIDQPWFPDRDLVHEWACHLAYGQFHIKELEDGTALRILDEDM